MRMTEVRSDAATGGSGATSFASAADLASAMRRAEAAHGEHEKRTGQHDANWPDWYAAYIVAEAGRQGIARVSDEGVARRMPARATSGPGRAPCKYPPDRRNFSKVAFYVFP